MVVRVFKFTEHYEIHRATGKLGGKLTDQPVITIIAGRAKRTVLEQTELEWKSIISKQRDKGYKLLEELGEVEPHDYNTIDARLPKLKTNASGDLQPMMAKATIKWEDKKHRDKWWWISRKLDGVRAPVRLVDGELSASSKMGKDYDAAFTGIFKNGKLKRLIEDLSEGLEEPVMLDGELYIHGRTLQHISGLARKQTYDEDTHGELEYWIFDYSHPTHTAEERCTRLNKLLEKFKKEDRVRINQHVKLQKYDSIKKIHDIWVQDGFEGAIARDSSCTYSYGTRDARMVKIKEFQDDEFEIIGKSDGLRPEDMVFKCLTRAGKEFEAKPIGTREVKHQYIKDMDNIVGKMGTVKFFNYTPDGIPYLPILKVIRDYE